MVRGQQRDTNTFLGKVEAWNRFWFEWKMDTLKPRVIFSAVFFGLVVIFLLWIRFYELNHWKEIAIADAQECFDERKDEILAYIADVPDADEAARLMARYDDLAQGLTHGLVDTYCLDVVHLDTDAEFAGYAPGEYPDDLPWPNLFGDLQPTSSPSPSPSPSVSVSPTP